jgi:DNA-binding NarL/FixJ family response regulator
MGNNRYNLLFLSKNKVSELNYSLQNETFKIRIESDLNNLKLINSFETDLVIYNGLEDFEAGITFFEENKKSLISSGIPFFILAEDIEKEDLLIALEVGVDNIINWPIKTESINRKLLNAISKSKAVNIFKTRDFISFFRQTKTPIALARNQKVILGNNSLLKIFPFLNSSQDKSKLSDVFSFSHKKNHLHELKRFQTGLCDSLHIHNVPTQINESLEFDLYFFRPISDTPADYMIEFHPSKEKLSVYHTGLDISEESDFEKLTKREKEVFELSAMGLPIKIIAEKMNLSKRTVERHRANIMEKSGAKNIIEAIGYYRRHYTLN